MRPQPGLSGTGRVADDLYLIAHHEVSGRPYLSPRTSGIGLAGGLLAELLAEQTPAVTLDHGRLRLLYRKNGAPVARHARPEDLTSGQVLDLIVKESQSRPVRDWLLFLGKTSAAQVAGRLEHAGYLTRSRNRTPWRTRPPAPVDASCSVCALLRARGALGTARPLTQYAAALAGLVTACGLGFRLSDLADVPVRSAEEVAQMLPRPLRELIAHVQVTADAVVLSART